MSEHVLGLRWGGRHTCGQRVELLWVTPELAHLQGLPHCLHLDLAGAALHAPGRLVCDRCGQVLALPASSPALMGGKER